MYEQREGQGSLWKNNYKEKENQPDLKGTVLINGQLYEVAAWKRQTQSGEQFFSLKVAPKTQQGAPAQVAAPAAPAPTSPGYTPQPGQQAPGYNPQPQPQQAPPYYQGAQGPYPPMPAQANPPYGQPVKM